jgi:peptidoglycan/xylan/chitin deacetylase (PgdA/CDA1 family)
MVFSLRIDVESNKGIKEGIPKILDLLKKHNLKASFYLTMGGESNIFDILRYRKKLEGERGVKVFSKLEILRMVLFPRDFVSNNKEILKRILKEGHELGIHGWKHRKWTRGLEKIDCKNEIEKAIIKYEKIFGIKPKSFCAPAFRMNKEVIEELNKKDFKVISDLEGTKPFKIKDTNITNVPITIKGKGNTPIIEYLVSKKFSDEEILEYLKKEIVKKDYSIMYIHDLYECIQKVEFIDKLFYWINSNKIKTDTIYNLGIK